MKWIGRTVSFFGMYLVYIVTFGPAARHGGGFPWSITIFSIVAGAAVLGFGNWITSKDLTVDQEKADAEARQSFESLSMVGKSLYLRPFETDGKFVVDRSYVNFFSWEIADRPGVDSIERVFADAFAKTAPLVGLGGRGDVEFGLGAAQLVADWKVKITNAITQVEYILIIPSTTDGTLWELSEVIRQVQLKKTIFIMPPTDRYFSYQGTKPYAEQWKEAAAEIKSSCALEIPTYDPAGKLFKMNLGGSIENWTELKPDPNGIVNAVNELFR